MIDRQCLNMLVMDILEQALNDAAAKAIAEYSETPPEVKAEIFAAARTIIHEAVVEKLAEINASGAL